jgi:hypothetical protein
VFDPENNDGRFLGLRSEPLVPNAAEKQNESSGAVTSLHDEHGGPDVDI